MAERAGAGTSLRGLRERMVAAANAIAEERRSQGSFSALPSQPSNIKSAFKPVIDGSVLKNDVKQRLAKERREEKKRQDDANKETQLLEKERKSKILYEKQMEEKQRKLREQKEKDEQRRISAEKKRNEKLQEERERFKAVLHRTLERSSRVDHQKRWSWEGSTTVNSQNKTANKHSISTEKLEQGTSGLHKQMSSASSQNSIAKKTTEKRRSSSLNRRCSKLHSSTEQVEEKTPGIHNIFQYVNMPLLKHSSDELKSTIVPHKSTVIIPPQEKVDTPSKTSVEAVPKASVEVPLEVSVEAPPEASLEVSPEASLEVSPEVSVEAPPEVSLEVSPEVSVEAPPEVSLEVSPEVSVEAPPEASLEVSPEASVEAPPEASLDVSPEASLEVSPEASVEAPPEASAGTPCTSVETSPEASEDLSLEASVNPSPEVSMDSSPEVSVDSSPEVSTEASSEASVEASPEASVEASPEESTEVPSEASMEAPPEASPEATMGMSSKKSETDKQASNLITKKRLPPSQIPCYRWSSSPTSRWCPPSPISASRQIQKNRPPSPSPVTSKQSTQFSFSCRAIPMQRTVFAQNALGTIGMKSEAISNTINSSEAASQKDMICEESGNKSTPGPMNAEEATKILAEKRRLAREQKEKEEERLQKEMEQRKMKDIAKKADEGQQEEFSKFGDGQPPKEIKKKKGSQEQEDQKVELQKSDAKIKAQEEADKRKKEHERIMLQNLQERLERKKRIEEIMKRTRRPDSNTSKATETFSNDAYEEDEADDEDESESDSDSFDDMHPSAFINGTESSTKPKTHFKNVKNTRKLVLLDATSSYIRKETKTLFNCDMKTFRQKRVKDPLNQTKSARSSTKRTANRAAKPGKAETSNTVGPSKSLHSEAQDWVCDKIIDITGEIEPPKSSIPPDSRKHHLKGPTTSCLSHQLPIENKKTSKSVSALSDM
ncbi:MAP7 domain-containing protein 3 isoform X3 [Balaenoptera musculus]|uniref:MAP7 domain-containing protein 3 isoform X3 n=1 Tax=Balaenoptera musculus TaxID=9771 RepID=A0A8B8WHK5_BALMU|nr:MAP7 domain-containing protein 3 isoform X3 [Balaenoptera musculus]